MRPAPQILLPREVPLGGLRAMTVRRTLPTRQRSLIGAWCFVDHYGPGDVSRTGGMLVPPHPHTGLATVSWLFSGEIEHRDSAGHHAWVRPGELNLMSAGRGISHSEVSADAVQTLHGAQLWLALPDDARFGDPRFEHYAPSPVQCDDATVRVFLGSLAGETSPVATATPLLGAEVLVPPGGAVEFDIDPTYELGVLVDAGPVAVAGVVVEPGALAYVAPGDTPLRLAADSPARVLLLGGPPFGEQIVMWWNFVGRTHEEIEEFRRLWQGQIEGDGPGHFGWPVGDERAAIPAPALPHVRLRSRG